jgi:hypothetical protein
MKLTIRPLTPQLWPTVEDLFGELGACNGCWCMYWRIGAAYRNRARRANQLARRVLVSSRRSRAGFDVVACPTPPRLSMRRNFAKTNSKDDGK